MGLNGAAIIPMEDRWNCLSGTQLKTHRAFPLLPYKSGQFRQHTKWKHAAFIVLGRTWLKSDRSSRKIDLWVANY